MRKVFKRGPHQRARDFLDHLPLLIKTEGTSHEYFECTQQAVGKMYAINIYARLDN